TQRPGSLSGRTRHPQRSGKAPWTRPGSRPTSGGSRGYPAGDHTDGSPAPRTLRLRPAAPLQRSLGGKKQKEGPAPGSTKGAPSTYANEDAPRRQATNGATPLDHPPSGSHLGAVRHSSTGREALLDRPRGAPRPVARHSSTGREALLHRPRGTPRPAARCSS